MLKMDINTTDEKEKAEILKNRIIYSLPVRQGYWNEELAIREAKHNLVNYKRNHCQLTIQKLQRVYNNLLLPTELAAGGEFVCYGKNYQLQACELPNTLETQSGTQATHGLYLSGLLGEHEIDYQQNLVHGCVLTASPRKTACVRNTFTFEGCDIDRYGQSVNYGEDVFIKINHSEGLSLYVQCENSTFATFGEPLPLRLTQSPDIYSRFKILHWKPSLRKETVQTSFPPNTRVIIQHTASGQNFAGEYQKWLLTFFGPECMVTCRTYRDSHRMETAENMWKIVGVSTPDINMYVRAAKGEDIPVDMLN